MKKVLTCLVLSCFLINVQAQTKPQKKKTTARTVVKKKSVPTPETSSVTVLNSSGANKAYASSAIKRLQIADTTISTMNERAAGGTILFNGSPIAGMPKSTYGIANGKILLRNTTATTSGSSYGSGSVGTGTSISGTGTSESTIGVNGKSPYAGVWLWGDRRPVYTLPNRDSVRRQ